METIPLKYNAYNNENLFTSSEVELMETKTRSCCNTLFVSPFYFFGS